MYLGKQNYRMVNMSQQLPHNYISTVDPTIDINPPIINMTWLNSSSGEVFVCTDNTSGANAWVGSNSTRVPNIIKNLTKHINGGSGTVVILPESIVLTPEDGISNNTAVLGSMNGRKALEVDVIVGANGAGNRKYFDISIGSSSVVCGDSTQDHWWHVVLENSYTLYTQTLDIDNDNSYELRKKGAPSPEATLLDSSYLVGYDLSINTRIKFLIDNGNIGVYLEDNLILSAFDTDYTAFDYFLISQGEYSGNSDGGISTINRLALL